MSFAVALERQLGKIMHAAKKLLVPTESSAQQRICGKPVTGCGFDKGS